MTTLAFSCNLGLPVPYISCFLLYLFFNVVLRLSASSLLHAFLSHTYSLFLSSPGTENYNRSVFLRWAPEMNGDWMAYGRQPLMYIDVWKSMYTTIKAIAPNTAVIWAPNTGQG